MPLLSLWDTEGDVDRDEEATELIVTAELDLAASESTHCRRRELLDSGADGIGPARLLSPTNRVRGTRGNAIRVWVDSGVCCHTVGSFQLR